MWNTKAINMTKCTRGAHCIAMHCKTCLLLYEIKPPPHKWYFSNWIAQDPLQIQECKVDTNGLTLCQVQMELLRRAFYVTADQNFILLHSHISMNIYWLPYKTEYFYRTKFVGWNDIRLINMITSQIDLPNLEGRYVYKKNNL